MGHTHEPSVACRKREHAVRVIARVPEAPWLQPHRRSAETTSDGRTASNAVEGKEWNVPVFRSSRGTRRYEPRSPAIHRFPIDRTYRKILQPEEEPHRRLSGTGSHISLPPGLGLDASQVPVIDPNAEEELGRDPANEMQDPVGPDNEPNPSESNDWW